MQFRYFWVKLYFWGVWNNWYSYGMSHASVRCHWSNNIWIIFLFNYKYYPVMLAYRGNVRLANRHNAYSFEFCLQDSPGMAACAMCAPGTAQGLTGQKSSIACIDCSPGSYAVRLLLLCIALHLWYYRPWAQLQTLPQSVLFKFHRTW